MRSSVWSCETVSEPNPSLRAQFGLRGSAATSTDSVRCGSVSLKLVAEKIKLWETAQNEDLNPCYGFPRKLKRIKDLLSPARSTFERWNTGYLESRSSFCWPRHHLELK